MVDAATSDLELLAGRSDRFAAVIAAIDEANVDDPETIEVDGQRLPKELTHARMMCGWVLRLDPDATELQLLAARAHHLQRWRLPRTDYPEGRAGYLRWRAEQKRRHAARVAELMQAAGYGDGDAARVAAIVRKEGLRDDPVVQTHEDALCLVFLQTQFDPVTDSLGEDKMVDVLVKTIPKMSERGVAAAGELDLGTDGARLLGQAADRLADGAE